MTTQPGHDESPTPSDEDRVAFRPRHDHTLMGSAYGIRSGPGEPPRHTRADVAGADGAGPGARPARRTAAARLVAVLGAVCTAVGARVTRFFGR